MNIKKIKSPEKKKAGVLKKKTCQSWAVSFINVTQESIRSLNEAIQFYGSARNT